MACAGDKRVRDVDDKPNYIVRITSSDEDDDDDYDSIEYVSSPRKPTEEEIFDYYRQAFSSKGFDVPETGCLLAGGIGPYRIIDETREQRVTDMAKQALQVYNDENNARFEFDHLVKANSQAVAGLMFYITFMARSGDNASQTFYARVWKKICNQGTEVRCCVMATEQ